MYFFFFLNHLLQWDKLILTNILFCESYSVILKIICAFLVVFF